MMTTETRQPGRPKEPAQITILPGLSSLLVERQIGIFPAFRAAMLEDASRQPSLRGSNWLGRDVEDFGVMLTEMFAYVCDVLAFYDGFNANESYLRTAMRLSSTHHLSSLIGYLPRPAVAAMADLAFILEGRLPIVIPPGTAFRSGSFTDEGTGEKEKPQVFTALDGGTVHPLRAKFTLTPQPATVLGGTVGSTLLTKQIIAKRGSVTVKAGDPLFIRAGTKSAAAVAANVENTDDPAGNPITRVSTVDTLELAGGASINGSVMLRPTGSAFVNSYYYINSPNLNPPGYYYRGVYLDAYYRQIKTGDTVLMRKGDHVRWFTVEKAESYNWVVQSSQTITSNVGGETVTTTVPAVTTPVSRLTFVQEWNGNDQRAPEDTESWSYVNQSDLTFLFGLVPAGILAGEATPAIGADDALKVREKVESVAAEFQPETFIVRDLDENAAVISASLSTDGTLTVSDAGGWEDDFTPPVTLYGAIVRVTRGEWVRNEVLGIGDGSQPNQMFKLKKKLLTYLDAPDSESGVRATLEIYVDGVKWREVPRFYGVSPEANVYIIRQNTDGESLITFGDGIRGARLTSGSQVVATYMHGAGAAAPPARTITQMVTPIKGVTALVNPLAAFGGADAEDESGMKTYAPRSALMLGRAVSLADYQAAAALVTGVRSATAEWQWSGVQQRPLVKVWYIGEGELGALIKTRLESLSAEGVPFEVESANPIYATLHVNLAVHEDYIADVVSAEVVTVLTEALAPEKTGIGAAFIRSKVLALVAGVEGVIAPEELYVNGYPFPAAGYRPPAGYYIEFTSITAGE